MLEFFVIIDGLMKHGVGVSYNSAKARLRLTFWLALT
jgi:hypothetical protein